MVGAVVGDMDQHLLFIESHSQEVFAGAARLELTQSRYDLTVVTANNRSRHRCLVNH